MRKFAMILLVLAACFTIALPCLAQPSPDDLEYVDDDFAPGLGLFALLMVIIMLMLVGAGAALAFLAACIVGLLAMLGILTTSTLAGIFSRRPRTAVKAFFLQLGSALGLPAGGGLAMLAAWIFKFKFPAWAVISTGAALGIAGGFLLAWLFNIVWDRFLTFLVNQAQSKPPAANS